MGAIDLLVLDFAGVCTVVAETSSAPTNPSGKIHIRPEIEEIVDGATQLGVEVVILSNEISTDWDVALFERVSHVVNCADNNIFKPDRRAFERCLLLTGARPERTLVVDDHEDNIAVAASLGMSTVLYDEADPSSSHAAIWEMLT